MADGVELNISSDSKEKLRCFVCEGYLMCSPIRILPDGNNICGRCTPTNKDTVPYRNHSLEAILKNAVFPCKFKDKGCSKRLYFISDSDHESSCTYNSRTSLEAVVNNSNNDCPIKCSESMCGQEELPGCSSKGENVFPVPKPANAKIANTSVCTDVSAGGSNWQEPANRNASTSSNASRTTNYYNARRRRAASVSSNRSQRLNWTGPQPSPFRDRPYNNFVENRNNWQNPWYGDRRPEHINMYKRRNNLIIIKGGTFYVNW